MQAIFLRRAVTAGCVASALAVAMLMPAARASADLRPASLHLPGDLFGDAIAISGDTAVVGAWGVSNNAGAAYIFVRSHGAWHQQAELKDPGHSGADDFGIEVAISGNTALIGAEGTGNGAGAAYIFVRSHGAWHQQAKLTDKADPQADFGFSVAISGSTAIVSAYGAPNGGAIFVYVRSGARWRVQARLANPIGTSNTDAFGFAVAVWGGTALLTAENLLSTRTIVEVYTRSGTRWHQQGALRDPQFKPNDFFGDTVTIYGATAAVGAWNLHKGSGAVYVYARSGSAWHRQKTLLSPHPSAPDEFGDAVALSKASGVLRLLIGASNGQHGDGDAYSFSHLGTAWREKAVIANPGGKSPDAFGHAVGLSGRNAIIGAPGKNNNTGAVYDLTLP